MECRSRLGDGVDHAACGLPYSLKNCLSTPKNSPIEIHAKLQPGSCRGAVFMLSLRLTPLGVIIGLGRAPEMSRRAQRATLGRSCWAGALHSVNAGLKLRQVRQERRSEATLEPSASHTG